MTSTLPDTEKAFDTSQSVPQRSESTMTDFPVTPMNKYPFPQRRFGAQHGQVAIHSPKKRMAPGFPNAILTSRRTKYRGFTRDHPLVAHINGKSLQRFPLSKDDWIDAGVDPLTFKPEATNTYKDALCEAADAKINRTYEIFRERLDHGEVEIFPCEIGEETGTTELSNPSVTYYKAHELAKTMAKPFADEKIEIVEKSEDDVETKVMAIMAQRMDEYMRIVEDCNLKFKDLSERQRAIEEKIQAMVAGIIHCERDRDQEFEEMTNKYRAKIDDFGDELQKLFNDAEQEESEKMSKISVSPQKVFEDESSLPEN